jgi:hypothetical protein
MGNGKRCTETFGVVSLGPLPRRQSLTFDVCLVLQNTHSWQLRELKCSASYSSHALSSKQPIKLGNVKCLCCYPYSYGSTNTPVYTQHRISCGTRDNFINFVQRRTKIEPANVNISRVAVMWRYMTAFRFFSHWIPFRSIERRQLCAKPLVNFGWHAQVKCCCVTYWATGADRTLLASWLSPLWYLHVCLAVILWSHQSRSNSYFESAHPHWLLFFLSISFYVTSTPSLLHMY